MENGHEVQAYGASTADVVAIPGEPAVIINGVPDPSPEFLNDTAIKQSVREAVSETIEYYGQGEWLKGRKVLKKFGKKYYKGKVQDYDPETNWYMVTYEDGDREEMELHDLQMVMLPLDIKSPLKTWLLKLSKCNTPKQKLKRKEKQKGFKTKRKAVKKKSKGGGSQCAAHGICLGCR